MLKQNGVERYDAAGQPFDPNLHNALFDIPDPTKENNTIAVVTKVSAHCGKRRVELAALLNWQGAGWVPDTLVTAHHAEKLDHKCITSDQLSRPEPLIPSLSVKSIPRHTEGLFRSSPHSPSCRKVTS